MPFCWPGQAPSLLVTVEGRYSGTASLLATVAATVAEAGAVAAAAVAAAAETALEELLWELQPAIHADNSTISGTAAQRHRVFTDKSRRAARHEGPGISRWHGRWRRWNCQLPSASNAPGANVTAAAMAIFLDGR